MATLTTIRRELERLRTAALATSPNQLLAELQRDPALILSRAGLAPDPWQQTILRSSHSRMMMLCSRQSGKSTVAAALALREALLRPPALVLILSPTLRQSGELFKDKVLPLYSALGRPVPATQESALTMTLANGSRVVSLPGEEQTIRGYSGVRLLIVDEAARVDDSLYFSVRPMLAVSKGTLVLTSTPAGRRGFFFEEWHGEGEWERVRIDATQCPRITADFLAEEERTLGPFWYTQEYMLAFNDAVDSYFRQDDIDAALSTDEQPFEFGIAT
jgi:hypothetical protein